MESKFIGSRAVDPSLEDSLAYIKSYRPTANFANPISTHRWRTTPPTRGLHRFPLNNGAIPEHATTRLRDWVIRLSPAEGSNGDPQSQTRRFIGTELTDQFLLFIDEPPFTILRLGSFIRSFSLLPHQLSLATKKEQLACCNGLPRNRDKA